MALVEHRLPRWIKPQLTRLAEEAPKGTDWLHEIKYDGYRMHARIDAEKIQLLTRTGLDWSHRYKRTIESLRSLKVKSAHLDGELCALNADGLPVFSRLQAAMDEGRQLLAMKRKENAASGWRRQLLTRPGPAGSACPPVSSLASVDAGPIEPELLHCRKVVDRVVVLSEMLFAQAPTVARPTTVLAVLADVAWVVLDPVSVVVCMDRGA